MMSGKYTPEEMPDAARHMEWSEPYSILWRLGPRDDGCPLEFEDWLKRLVIVHGPTIYEMAGMETNPHFFDSYMSEDNWEEITPDYDALEKEGTEAVDG
jgi:hypothetical protein